MRILLDTHVWLWWLLGSDRLPTQEHRALNRLASRAALGLAAVSLWEAQMLHAKGRLTLDRPFDTWIREAADEHLSAVVRDSMGRKYAQGGFGNPAKPRNESTAMGKDWRWIVFTPERCFSWDNSKLPKRPPKPAAQ